MGQPGGQRAGKITPAAGTAKTQPAAEHAFVTGELAHVTAEATTIGLPSMRAKQNIEMRGVGRKFSGVYYVEAVRHRIDSGGYSCELTLRRNALGKGAGHTATDTLGKRNTQHASTAASSSASSPARTSPSPSVTIDANTGRRVQ
jgi:hypothetical protein